jgi:hypothetical protein
MSKKTQIKMNHHFLLVDQDWWWLSWITSFVNLDHTFLPQRIEDEEQQPPDAWTTPLAARANVRIKPSWFEHKADSASISDDGGTAGPWQALLSRS